MKKLSNWQALVVILLLVACSDESFKKPKYPPNAKPTLYTTISLDGKLVAALDQIGTEKPRLRIKWLDKDLPWQELQAPPFTNSIRFGLTGYGLLMTHSLPGKSPLAQLTRWDVSDLTRSSEMLYTGPNLAFPIETKPGQILVRTCTPYDWNPDRCGTDWFLVSPDGTGQQVSPKDVSLVYSQPNITSGGFFWLDQRINKERQGDREILAYPLPNGRKPEVSISMLNEYTADLDCDYQTKRCLHAFNAGKNPTTGHFIYDLEIFDDSRRCRPTGLTGWSDGGTLSPDGRVAVMSLAKEYDSPRHVVIMRFKTGQCEPTLINHLNF